MSNIYIQEPPTEGKVLLETTVGDIDIELWSREAPKAARNFIQLCMEGYYDRTIFHRLVKGFIVQGGDPTGTGEGGNSVWGKPFKDEFHSRLRFNRRGLVGMANAGRDDNGSQFFFTLGATPELQNKHTIFGKVGGNTIYNMIKLEEGEVGGEDRPLYPHKILRTKILHNPFDDIKPRESIKSKELPKEKKSKATASATKNYSLLSFGEEAEEEEEEIQTINKTFTGKGKSSHDLTSDPKLSAEAVQIEEVKKSSEEEKKEEKKSSDEEEEEEGASKPSDITIAGSAGLTVSSVKEKLSSKRKEEKPGKSKATHSSSKKKEASSDEEEEEYYLGKAEKDAERVKIEALRKEYRQLKRSMKEDKEASVAKKAREEEEVKVENAALTDYLQEKKEYTEKTKASKGKGEDREAKTLALLAKFKNKISSAMELHGEEVEKEEKRVKGEEEKKVGLGGLYEGEEEKEDPNDLTWLAKSLHNEVSEAVLAKDANKKSDDWYEIYDPKNPLNRRRREESKRAEGEKWKKLRPVD